MLLIIGVSSLIKPITYNTAYNMEMIILIAGTLLLSLFPIIPPKNKMNRWNGAIYLVMYAIYMGVLFVV